MSFGLSSAGVLIPLLAKENLGASAKFLGSYGLAFNLVYVLFGLAAGRLHRAVGFRVCVFVAGLCMTASSVWMFYVANRYAVYGPCLLWGAAGGFFWPAIEGAASHGQTSEGIKRGLSRFSVSWVTGAMVGLFANGWIYELDMRVPFIVSACLGIFVSAMTLVPRFFAFAPWSEGRPHNDENVSTDRRRLFVRLAFQANFAIWVGVACIRILLPEYAAANGLTGMRYGLLMSAIMAGFLASNAVLTHWHGWHYSGKILTGSLSVSALALVGLSVFHSYAALLSMQFFFGTVLGLTYFSSLYYGMERGGATEGHGGRHEAIIGLACGVGPMLGGWVIAATDWDRSAFPAAACFILAMAAAHIYQLSRR